MWKSDKARRIVMILVKPSFELIMWSLGALELIELAGRTCYKSEDKITPESSEELCRKIIKRGHLSVIEHATATVKFVVDRGVSHELVRHRLCAFSQESTRYCNYKGGVTFVIPSWEEKMEEGKYHYDKPRPNFRDASTRLWFKCMLSAEIWYLELLKDGWTPQEARSVLSNSLKTEIVVTANFREWRHIFSQRCSSAAHPQMREVMIPLRDKFRELFPVIFDDCTEGE